MHACACSLRHDLNLHETVQVPVGVGSEAIDLTHVGEVMATNRYDLLPEVLGTMVGIPLPQGTKLQLIIQTTSEMVHTRNNAENTSIVTPPS